MSLLQNISRARLQRRQFIALGAASVIAPSIALAAKEDLIVSKSPTCGCCQKWADHMKEAGFNIVMRELEQKRLTALKDRLGVPYQLRSCHTAEIGGYVIEGHVPPIDVQALLSFLPYVIGVAVPGMPVGSPGMEVGDEVEPYASFAFSASGDIRPFSHHGGSDSKGG